MGARLGIGGGWGGAEQGVEAWSNAWGGLCVADGAGTFEICIGARQHPT